jgi:hypothetical protein
MQRGERGGCWWRRVIGGVGLEKEGMVGRQWIMATFFFPLRPCPQKLSIPLSHHLFQNHPPRKRTEFGDGLIRISEAFSRTKAIAVEEKSHDLENKKTVSGERRKRPTIEIKEHTQYGRH